MYTYQKLSHVHLRSGTIAKAAERRRSTGGLVLLALSHAGTVSSLSTVCRALTHSLTHSHPHSLRNHSHLLTHTRSFPRDPHSLSTHFVL